MEISHNVAETLSVLLVDDDHDVLGANARFLRVNGIDVLVADSAGVALSRLAESTVDIIVTDLRMPDCDGIEFARQVRERVPLMPILFFSGFARVPDVVSAMKLGAVDFLEKPVEPQTLLDTLFRIRQQWRGPISLQRNAFEIADDTVPFRQRVLAYEKHLIESSFRQCDGQVACVLKALRINRRTLNEKMTRLGINRKRESHGDDDNAADV